ncbi:MAG: hypothetical protein RI907_3186 [Pseudomonadota bacterium]
MPPVAVTASVLYRALWLPDNHIGFEPSLFMGAAGFSLIAAALSTGRFRLLACAVSLATWVIIGGAIHFNLLLSYEAWIRLGMPDKPSWAAIGR